MKASCCGLSVHQTVKEEEAGCKVAAELLIESDILLRKCGPYHSAK